MEARLGFRLVINVRSFGKDSIFLVLDYSSFVGALRKMSGKEGVSGVEGGASGMKTIQSLNIYYMKIDVEKFNGTNNFGL